MDYVATHAKALARMKQDGFQAVFTHTTPGTYDPLTDSETPPVVVAVSGYAVEIPADPEEYNNLGLVLSQAITLQWVPETMGDTPRVGATITYLDLLRTIKEHFPIRPNGILITDKVILT